MPTALILVADGSEEIEFVTPYDGKKLPSHHYDHGELTQPSSDSRWVRAPVCWD